MACVIDDPNGRKRIQFMAGDGSRRTVRLGRCSRRDAEQVCRHIEALLAATISGQPVSRETAVWLSGIGHKLHDRLARAALVEARAAIEGTTLGPFIDAYIAGRVDAKPRTIINLKQAGNTSGPRSARSLSTATRSTASSARWGRTPTGCIS